MMRIRALTGIASAGILAVTVGVETANAQSYRCYGATRTCTPQPYPPQSRGSIPRGGPRTVPFSDPIGNGPGTFVTIGTERMARSRAGRMPLADQFARRLHPTPSLTPRRAPAHGCATTRENVMADESLRRHSLADARESFDVTEQHGHHGLRGEQNRALTGIRRSISLFCTISVASTSRR
jgi:hypothetical protein